MKKYTPEGMADELVREKYLYKKQRCTQIALVVQFHAGPAPSSLFPAV